MDIDDHQTQYNTLGQQSHLERRIARLEVPFGVHMDPWQPEDRNMTPVPDNPCQRVAGKLSMDPRVQSWVQRMRMRPDKLDVSFHMRLLE